MKHPVSGELKELTQKEFLDLFDPAVHSRIVANSMKPGVEAVVCFEVLQMDSSQFGKRSALIVGPGCSHRLVDMEKPDAVLGQTPSSQQYPTAYWKI